MTPLARLAAILVLAVAWPALAQRIDPARVPEEQRSKSGLYLDAKATPGFIKAQKGKVLFLDVRTRAEAQFLGMAEGVDALIPYVEFQEFMTDWDESRGFYKLEPFNDFAPEVERRMKEKGLGKGDPVVIICRAGERSAPRSSTSGDATGTGRSESSNGGAWSKAASSSDGPPSARSPPSGPSA